MRAIFHHFNPARYGATIFPLYRFEAVSAPSFCAPKVGDFFAITRFQKDGMAASDDRHVQNGWSYMVGHPAVLPPAVYGENPFTEFLKHRGPGLGSFWQGGWQTLQPSRFYDDPSPIRIRLQRGGGVTKPPRKRRGRPKGSKTKRPPPAPKPRDTRPLDVQAEEAVRELIQEGSLIPSPLGKAIRRRSGEITRKIIAKVERIQHVIQGTEMRTSVQAVAESTIKQWVHDEMKDAYGSYLNCASGKLFGSIRIMPVSFNGFIRKGRGAQTFSVYEHFRQIEENDFWPGAQVRLRDESAELRTVKLITNNCKVILEGSRKAHSPFDLIPFDG